MSYERNIITAHIKADADNTIKIQYGKLIITEKHIQIQIWNKCNKNIYIFILDIVFAY